METPDQIIATLGIAAVAARMHVTEEAVRKALKAGKLPAPWFAALEQMATADLPRDCFTFKGLSVHETGDEPDAVTVGTSQ